MSDPHIFDVIDSLIAARPLDAAKAQKLLDTRLERDRDSDTSAAQAWALPEGRKGGRYETVDLRLPDEDIGDAVVFLSVTMRDDEGVNEEAILARYGEDFRTEAPSPRFKPGTVPLYLIYETDWGSLCFGVTADDAARLVRFILNLRVAEPADADEENEE